MALRPLHSLPCSSVETVDAVRWASRAHVVFAPAPPFLAAPASDGDVRISDERISFHPARCDADSDGGSNGGRAVGVALHPAAIAVHALTTLPQSDSPALYIIIDDAPEEDGPNGAEMWIALPHGSQQTLAQAFDAVSDAVRRHTPPPAISRAEDGQAADGAFDDAAGDSDSDPATGADELGLSPQGQVRFTPKHRREAKLGSEGGVGYTVETQGADSMICAAHPGSPRECAGLA